MKRLVLPHGKVIRPPPPPRTIGAGAQQGPIRGPGLSGSPATTVSVQMLVGRLHAQLESGRYLRWQCYGLPHCGGGSAASPSGLGGCISKLGKWPVSAEDRCEEDAVCVSPSSVIRVPVVLPGGKRVARKVHVSQKAAALHARAVVKKNIMNSTEERNSVNVGT